MQKNAESGGGTAKSPGLQNYPIKLKLSGDSKVGVSMTNPLSEYFYSKIVWRYSQSTIVV